MKKLLFLAILCALGNATNSRASQEIGSGLFISYSSGFTTTHGMDSNKWKMEKIKEEAVTILAEGEITGPSDLMRSFLLMVRKDARFKNLSDLDILEIFINESETK